MSSPFIGRKGHSYCSNMSQHSPDMRQHSRNMRQHSPDMRQHSRNMRQHSRNMRQHSSDMRQHGGKMSQHSPDMRQHGGKMSGHGHEMRQPSAEMSPYRRHLSPFWPNLRPFPIESSLLCRAHQRLAHRREHPCEGDGAPVRRPRHAVHRDELLPGSERRARQQDFQVLAPIQILYRNTQVGFHKPMLTPALPKVSRARPHARSAG